MTSIELDLPIPEVEEQWAAFCRGPTPHSSPTPESFDIIGNSRERANAAWEEFERFTPPDSHTPAVVKFDLPMTHSELDELFQLALGERKLVESANTNMDSWDLPVTSDRLEKQLVHLRQPLLPRRVVIWQPAPEELPRFERVERAFAALAQPVRFYAPPSVPWDESSLMPNDRIWDRYKRPIRVKAQELPFFLPEEQNIPVGTNYRARRAWGEFQFWTSPRQPRRKRERHDIPLRENDLNLAEIPEFNFQPATYGVEDLGKSSTRAPRPKVGWITHEEKSRRTRQEKRHRKNLATLLARTVRRGKLSFQPRRKPRPNENKKNTPARAPGTELQTYTAEVALFVAASSERAFALDSRLAGFVADIKRDAERGKQARKGRSRKSYGEKLLRGSASMTVGRWYLKFHQIQTVVEIVTRKGDVIDREKEVWVPDFSQTTWPQLLEKTNGKVGEAKRLAGQQTRWKTQNVSPAQLDRWETTAEQKARQHMLETRVGVRRPSWLTDDAEWERRQASRFMRVLELTQESKYEENPDLVQKVADTLPPRPQRRKK